MAHYNLQKTFITSKKISSPPISLFEMKWTNKLLIGWQKVSLLKPIKMGQSLEITQIQFVKPNSSHWQSVYFFWQYIN